MTAATEPRLRGRVAWVTGAGSGIGQATARALAEDGAAMVLSGRRPAPLEETAESIRAAGGNATVEALDVAEAEAVAQAAGRIIEAHGRLDILVNSAGLNTPNRNWPDLTPADWDLVVNVDLSGTYYCVAAVLPQMRAQRDGLIVNVSSWAGRYDTWVTGPAYNAAKHGLLAMNAHLNLEEGVNGIRACAICPGEVATPIMETRPVPPGPEARARMLQPEDLAETILFVARAHPRVCLNEILISPTWNNLGMRPNPPAA